MTTPDSFTPPADLAARELAGQIVRRIETLTSLEREEVRLVVSIQEERDDQRRVEAFLVRERVEGANERQRQAHLQDLLENNVQHGDSVQRTRGYEEALEELRIQIRGHQRLLALEMALLQRPAGL